MSQIPDAQDDGIDLLYISYQEPDYVRITLPKLCESVGDDVRIWVWHNGGHQATLDATRECAEHPRVHRFHHSDENGFVRVPTNWMWKEATGAYLSKVDDDGVLPPGWTDRLRAAHEDEPRFGMVGSWRGQPDDLIPELAEKKVRTFANGSQLMSNLWVEGSGYLMKRACLQDVGLLTTKLNFSTYGIELAKRGWENGWLYPFLYQEDLDDPRSPHTLMKTDADLLRRMPLGAHKNNIDSLEAWIARRKLVARQMQLVSADVRNYQGWRDVVRRAKRKAALWMRTGGKAPKWNPNW